MTKYFFDTYALVEINEENSSYESLIDSEMVINEFVFSEFCYYLERVGHKDKERLMNIFRRFVVRTDLRLIAKAMKFRNKWKKRKVSAVDCIGYFMAKDLGVKFLTGDKEFKGMKNVEFVR